MFRMLFDVVGEIVDWLREEIDEWLESCEEDAIEGEIEVCESGSYEISLPYTPKKVFIEFADDAADQAVCCATGDGVSVKIIPNGFVITVTLGSEYVDVKWTAIP